MKKIFIVIFISTIFSQIINHELIEVAYPNIPLNIEIEIETSNKKLINSSLFYRTPNQQNYFEISFLPIQKNYLFSLIPISALDKEYVEYIIVAEFNDGSSISFPSNDPFNNPYRVEIEQIQDDLDKSINEYSNMSDGGSLKSNALILSPIPNSNVNKDDILIALSLFSVKEPYLKKVNVILDDVNISEAVLIEDNLLTYIPEDINPGLHKISISIENKYGIRFENIEWSFNIVSSFSESQESSFKRSGKVSSDTYQSIIDDDIINYSTHNLLLRGNWDWLDLKTNIKISSLESIYFQPRNRYSLEFKTPFLILKLGDVNPQFNQYALWGTRIRGFETQINNKYLSFKFIQGELTRAVQGKSLDETMVINSLKISDSDIFEDNNGNGIWDTSEVFIDANLNGIYDIGEEEFEDCGLNPNGDYICEGDVDLLGNSLWDASFGNGEWDASEELLTDSLNINTWDKYGPDSIRIGRDNYTFKNDLYAIDFGVKYKKKGKINFHLLKSRDNTQSIYNKINGSIIHLTDELEGIIFDKIDQNNNDELDNSEIFPEYITIDTSIVVSDESIETLYDYKILYNDLISNCGSLFGDSYECQLISKDWDGKLPKDNIVFGSDLSWKLDDDHMIFESGFSFSLLNQNIWDPIFTGPNLDTLSVLGDSELDNQIAGSFEIPFEPSDYENIFIMNQSMYPLIPIDISSGSIGLKQILHMPSLAYHYKIKAKYLNHNMVLGYRQIGPDYFSLGNPNIQKNIREKTFSDKMKFFNNRMFVIFKYQSSDDGISLISETISSNNKMNLNINLYPGVGVPTFSLGVGVNTRDNGISTQYDTTVVAGNILLVEAGNRDYNKTIKTNILVTNQFKYYGFHNISLNISNSNKIDLIEVERGPDIFKDTTYISPRSTSEAYSLNLRSVLIGNVETSISMSKNKFTFGKGYNYGEQNLSFIDLGIVLKNTVFFKSINFGGNISLGEGLANFNQYTFKLSLNKNIYDILLFKTNFEYKRKIVLEESILYYNNYQITANLAYTF